MFWAKENAIMKLNVPTMACGGCAATIESAVKTLDPTATVDADLASKTVSVTTQETAQAVTGAIVAAGYPATAVR